MRVISAREQDLLLTLLHLRYLTTTQIHQRWYNERTLANCQVRLSLLSSDGFLQRVRIAHPTWKFAWRLSDRAFSFLQQALTSDIEPYDPLTSLFLPHLLETNQVFLRLVPSDSNWHTLPLHWKGSHRAALTYVETGRDGTGSLHQRKRIIRPDAIIESATGPRIFLELDRSTESIQSAIGRNSILSKLRRYTRYLTGMSPSGVPWHKAQFQDAREACVVFVVPSTKSQSRRRLSIIATARKCDERLQKRVLCITTDEIPTLAALLKLANAPAFERPAESHFTLAANDLAHWRDFYKVSLEAYRRLHPQSSVRPQFQRVACHVERTFRALTQQNRYSSEPHQTTHHEFAPHDASKQSLSS